MDLELTGARALVTGGSRGIGQSIVHHLIKEGCQVEFCGRTASRVRSAETPQSSNLCSANGSVVNLEKKIATTEWVKHAIKRLGGLDIVISNASAMATGNSKESWLQNYLVEIQSLSTIVAAAKKHLVHSARQRGDAAIVIIGSASTGRAKNVDAYGGTKAALVHTMKGLSHELISHGIRVNMVSPGPIYSQSGIWEKFREQDPDRFQRKVDQIPIGRMGKPEEISNIVLFLCSALSMYVVGSNILADGGRSFRPSY